MVFGPPPQTLSFFYGDRMRVSHIEKDLELCRYLRHPSSFRSQRDSLDPKDWIPTPTEHS